MSHGCGVGGTCGGGGVGSGKSESVDGIFWHHDGADFGVCEVDTRDELYRGKICFKHDDAARGNNFCMLDNAHVYNWEAGRDDPNAWIEPRHRKSQVEVTNILTLIIYHKP